MKAAWLALPIILTVSGCASTQGSGFRFQPTPLALVAIERECGLRGHFFYMMAEDELMLMPNPEERFEAVGCAMEALQKSEFSKNMKMGFVGNEMSATEEQK